MLSLVDYVHRSAPFCVIFSLLIIKFFFILLDKFSIEEIDPKDMKFDSENHEAMSTVEDENTEPGYIVEVIQKGYRLQNRLLRPARVIVSSDTQKD